LFHKIFLIFYTYKSFSFPDYTTTILEDSRVYANHAKKKTVDVEDIKLAITNQLSGSFAKPPPREVSEIYCVES
jgi:Transcription initiation factor TFIID, subunit TAF9 (also component of histone acetyltransferase SAGA)